MNFRPDSYQPGPGLLLNLFHNGILLCQSALLPPCLHHPGFLPPPGIRHSGSDFRPDFLCSPSFEIGQVALKGTWSVTVFIAERQNGI